MSEGEQPATMRRWHDENARQDSLHFGAVVGVAAGRCAACSASLTVRPLAALRLDSERRIRTEREWTMGVKK